MDLQLREKIYCTVYFKSMKFIVQMLLTTEHRFITSGKCLFQNSFNGPYVHSIISRSHSDTSFAAAVSERARKGAFSWATSRAFFLAEFQILVLLKSRWIY